MSLDYKELPEQKENKARMEQLVLLDQKEKMELKDPQEYLVKMAYTESTGNTVHLDPKVQWE